MPSGNTGKKSSFSNGLLLLKCHGSVAMIRLCDNPQYWFISIGSVEEPLSRCRAKSGSTNKKRWGLFAEATSFAPEFGYCHDRSAAGAIGAGTSRQRPA